MSGESETRFDPDLVEFYLGQLSDEQIAALKLRLANDPELQRQDGDLQQVFAALDRINDPSPASPGLSRRVARRIREYGTPAEHASEKRLLEREEHDRGPVILRLGSLREVVAIAAMVVLAVGLGVPGLLNMREWSKRTACSQQLYNLGLGLQQYASTFNASLPFAGWSNQASWRPTDDPNVTVMPNRKHPYQLVRQGFVAPQQFVCPGQEMHRPMPADMVTEFDDFPETRNISFAYQNMAGVRPSLNDDPRLVIMADENPLFEDGVPLVELIRSGFDASKRNSPAHGRKGQNLLSMGGHVRWSTTPAAGIEDDNIWTLNNVTDYSGDEGPRSIHDSHMLK